MANWNNNKKYCFKAFPAVKNFINDTQTYTSDLKIQIAESFFEKKLMTLKIGSFLGKICVFRNNSLGDGFWVVGLPERFEIFQSIFYVIGL